MSATSIGLVLVRPFLKSAATTAAKLKLRAGRTALHKALAPLRNYNPNNLRQALRNALGQPKPALAVERLVDPRAFRRGFGPGQGFPSSGRSYSTRAGSALGISSTLSRARVRPRGLGPSLVSRTGLPASPARAFSSGAAARELGVNVPIGFRALAEALRSEEDRLEAMRQGRNGRVIKNVRKTRRAGIAGGRWKGVASASSSAKHTGGSKGKAKQTIAEALEELFPTQPTTFTSVRAPVDTHLIIPLASTLTPFFAPACTTGTSRLFEQDPPKQPGLLAGVWDGVDPVHAQRVAGLLEVLIHAGLLDASATLRSSGSAIEIIYRRTTWIETAPDALRIVVSGRTTAEVRSRLHGSSDLASCHIYEVPRALSSYGSRSTSSLDISMTDSMPASFSTTSSTGWLREAAAEQAQWQMPVLDFSYSHEQDDTIHDNGLDGSASETDIWATQLPTSPAPRAPSSASDYASSLTDSLELELGSAAGSGWSTPVYSDHSASVLSADDVL